MHESVGSGTGLQSHHQTLTIRWESVQRIYIFIFCRLRPVRQEGEEVCWYYRVTVIVGRDLEEGVTLKFALKPMELP